jgi:hypothetical protein
MLFRILSIALIAFTLAAAPSVAQAGQGHDSATIAGKGDHGHRGKGHGPKKHKKGKKHGKKHKKSRKQNRNRRNGHRGNHRRSR